MQKNMITELKPLILSSIKKYYRGKETYEDLIQDGYKIILEAIESYDKDRNTNILWHVKCRLKYYYLNLNKLNEELLTLNLKLGNSKEEFVDTLESSFLLEEEFVEKESNIELKSRLKNLSKRQKEVIEMYYFQNKNMYEISDKLNVSYRTIVNTKSRAIEKLRNNKMNL